MSLRKKIYFCTIALSFAFSLSKGQSNIISFNANYIVGAATVKGSWNVVGGFEGFVPIDGFSLGFDWKTEKELAKKYKYSLTANFNNFGMKKTIPNVTINEFTKFSFINVRFNNYLKLTRWADLEFSPSINYLISLNTFNESSFGRIKSTNHFNYGSNNDRLRINKFTVGFSTGFRVKVKSTEIKLRYNSAIQPTAYLSGSYPFKVYLSSFEIGLVEPIFRF